MAFVVKLIWGLLAILAVVAVCALVEALDDRTHD